MVRRSLITSAATWSIPAAVSGQFLLAGRPVSLHDARLWAGHGIPGSALARPVGMIAVAPLTDRHVGHLRFWALAGLTLVGQSSGSKVLQALHAFNGALLLVVSFVLAQKAGLPPKASELR